MASIALGVERSCKSLGKVISSFSSLSNGQEVKQGLSRLRADITEGRIDEIMESYKHHLGDYLFVIGEKKAIGR